MDKLEYLMSPTYLENISKCVRCGGCKANCPTYDEGLTETAGARGRLTLLRGLLTEQLSPSASLRERIYDCLLCGACEKLCPLHVDITEAIRHGRSLLPASDLAGRCIRFFIRFSVKRPDLSFRIAQMLQHTVSPYLFRKGIIPFPLSLPDIPLKDDRQVYKPEKKLGRIALFTGCSTNYLFPSLGASLINVLIHLGYEVVLPKGEVCCGAPLRSLGMEDEAVELANKNYDVFGKLNAEAIISLCPTCVLSLKVHYPKLIGKELSNVMDISSFLSDKLNSSQLSEVRSLKSVTYHDPCHMIYSLGVEKEPRELIRSAGVDLVDAGQQGCCGFGGVFSLCYKDISRNLRGKTADAYKRTGADALVTSCPGCMLQLGTGLKDKPVLHIIELLEEAICQNI
jgi:glycolate oxidase iron-sulfur subunit